MITEHIIVHATYLFADSSFAEVQPKTVKTSTHVPEVHSASQAEDPKITITFMESQQDDYDFVNMADYHAAPSTKILAVQEWYAE